jgi:hypothetical protein
MVDKRCAVQESDRMDAEDGLAEYKSFRGAASGGPHVEVWHTTVNHLSSGAGFVIRYQYTKGSSGPADVLVAFVSKTPAAGSADVGVVVRYPGEQFTAGRGGLPVRFGACVVAAGRITGMVDAGGIPVTWDIVSRRVTDPLVLVGEKIRFGRTPLEAVVPHPFLHAGGRVQIGSHQFVLNGDPGHQAHLWGRGLAGAWTWMSCSSFLDGGGDVIPAYLVGYVEAGSGPGWWPRRIRSAGHLVWGETHVQLVQAEAPPPGKQGPWLWKGLCGNEEVFVSMRMTPAESFALTVPDTSGLFARLAVSPKADCEVEFRSPGRPGRRYVAAGSAYVETGEKCQQPGEPLRAADCRRE